MGRPRFQAEYAPDLLTCFLEVDHAASATSPSTFPNIDEHHLIFLKWFDVKAKKLHCKSSFYLPSDWTTHDLEEKISEIMGWDHGPHSNARELYVERWTGWMRKLGDIS